MGSIHIFMLLLASFVSKLVFKHTEESRNRRHFPSLAAICRFSIMLQNSSTHFRLDAYFLPLLYAIFKLSFRVNKTFPFNAHLQGEICQPLGKHLVQNFCSMLAVTAPDLCVDIEPNFCFSSVPAYKVWLKNGVFQGTKKSCSKLL